MQHLLIIIAILFSLPLACQKTHQENSIQIRTNGLKITPEKRRHEDMQFGWSVDILGKHIFVGSPLC